MQNSFISVAMAGFVTNSFNTSAYAFNHNYQII